jgi:hypothetical protein
MLFQPMRPLFAHPRSMSIRAGGLVECRIQMGKDRVDTTHDRVAVDEGGNRLHARLRLEHQSFLSVDGNLSRNERNPELGKSEPHAMGVGAPLRLPELDQAAAFWHEAKPSEASNGLVDFLSRLRLFAAQGVTHDNTRFVASPARGGQADQAEHPVRAFRGEPSA